MNKNVYIIGGGYSLKGFDFNKLKDKDTITINKSIFHVPNPTYFITCDYSFIHRLRHSNLAHNFETNKAVKFFIVQSHLSYLIEKEGKIIDIRTNKYIYDLKNFDVIIKSYKSEGVGFSWNDFRNGINSGFCALQIAILLGYKNIYLLGFDLDVKNENTHFHEGYGQSINSFRKKLDKYLEYYQKALTYLKNQKPEIKIYSCSKISKLNNIIPYKEI